MRVAAILSALLLTALPASAQIAAGNSAASPPTDTWRLAGGTSSLWIRDVSRTRRPVDASPVSWTGHGIALVAERDRRTARRLHHLEVSFEQIGDAAFRTPLAEFRRPGGDAAMRVDGRYEYRRYPFVDLGVRGLDVGVGIQGGAELTSVTQHFDPAIEVRVRETNLTTGLAAAARLRRWQRVQIEAAWINGLSIGRNTKRHSAAAEPTVREWGGGWLSDLTLRVDLRVSNRTMIFASYFGTGRGAFVSHDGSASGRRRWMMGVSHGR
jgi:hypothetical protein